MRNSSKPTIGKKLLAVLAAAVVCVSLSLVPVAPRVAFADSASSGTDTLEQLKQAYLDAQADYEAAEKAEADAKDEAEARAKDLADAQNAVNYYQGLLDDIEAGLKNVDNVESWLDYMKEYEADMQNQIVIAEDPSTTPEEKEQARDMADFYRSAMEFARKQAADLLGLENPEDVTKVPVTYALDNLFQQIGNELGVDPEDVHAHVVMQLRELEPLADAAKAASDEANDAYAAAVEKREAAEAARDAAKDAYESYTPPADEDADSDTDKAEQPSDSHKGDATRAKSRLPETSDGTSIVPAALLGFAGLAILIATRICQES